jgi:Cu+-exporting ATPase
MDVPIVLGIIAMFVQSAYELISKTGPGYFDTFTGLIFFMLIGRLFQQKTYHAISFFRDYRSYFPMSVSVQTEVGFQSVPLSRLKKSDVIRVRNEELIPADAQLMTEAASIDYHFVTGESAPVSIEKGDEVFAGGRLKGREALFLILKSVDQSYLTQLWNHDIFKQDKLTNHVTLADRVSPYFTWVVVSIALAAFFVWGQTDWHKAAQVLTSVLIIACPCALALSMPFTLGNVLNVFSKNDFYVRSERIIERLAKATKLVFDKTGTLTESGDMPLEYRGRELSEEHKQWLYAAASASTHPLSLAIAHHLKNFKGKRVDSFNEVKGLGLIADVAGHKLVAKSG